MRWALNIDAPETSDDDSSDDVSLSAVDDEETQGDKDDKERDGRLQ